MKKIYLIMLLALAATCLMAQPYKPMSEFGTDTLNYLKYNFETRKSYYIGYTLEKIINDYELTIERVSYTGPFGGTNDDDLTGISISHITIFEWRHRWANESPIIGFDIKFEPPYASRWTTGYYAPSSNTGRDRALYIKDKIVKDITVRIYSSHKDPPPPLPPLSEDPYITILPYIYPPQQYSVSVIIDGNGAVTGAGQYNENSAVTLTATPVFGHTFTGWQGDITSTSNPFTVSNITGNMNITATFTSTLPPTNPGDGGGSSNPKLPKKDLELTPLQ